MLKLWSRKSLDAPLTILLTLLALMSLAVASCGDDELTPPGDEDPLADAGGDTDQTDLSDASDAEGDGDAEAGDADAEPDVPGPDPCLSGVTVSFASEDPAFGVETGDGYGVSVPDNALEEAATLVFRCTDETIVPDGFTAVSRAVELEISLDAGGPVELARYFGLRVPFDAEAMPADAAPSAIRLFYSPPNTERVVSPPAVDMQENLGLGVVTFRVPRPGSFQLGVAEDAGETYQRTWTFRAVSGVSMGCSGATMLGFRNPDSFDIVGGLGGPSDWTYLLHYINVGGMGGFAPAPELGSAPPYEPTEEFEHPQRFDEWWFPTGEGTGGTFDRREYVSILQDLSLAFGNISLYRDDSPFLPPGLTAEELVRSADERCPGGASTTTIESGFYDDEYNPDGTLPVIMFCDGTSNQDRTLEFDRYCDLDENGTPDEPNKGLYPGPENQRRPFVISWAVDADGDGMRDAGEPVIRNFHEPFDDVGEDGLASPDEAGYDPVDNPDPSEDDYDYWDNPTGSEGNWLHDPGEPYQDVGLDGVADTPQLDEGGYDFGEGNEQFDYNPHLAQVLSERDPHHQVGLLTPEQWDNLTVYLDAGVRDLFNFGVATNHLAGQIQAAGQNLRIYGPGACPPEACPADRHGCDGFNALANIPQEDTYNFTDVDYGGLGDHVYLRYGDPDACDEEICYGDGKHVGTVAQIANRLLTLFGFITNRFPGGDFTILEPPYPTPSGDYRYYSASMEAWEQYSVILPPGHEWLACNDGDDNDGDGLIDGRDDGCEHGMDNSEGEGLGPAVCADGLDNDDDGEADFPDDPDCADADDTSEWPADHPLRSADFPVIYLLHGYGQTPDDLRATVVPFAGFEAGGFWQKVIVVYPDGFCGDNAIDQCNDRVDNDDDGAIDGDDGDCASTGGRGEDGVRHPLCDDGVDNDGDGLVDLDDGGCVSAEANDESDCVKGNFYTDHVAWPDGSSPGPAFEGAFFDLVEHVDAVYRTRAPMTTTEYR